MPTPTLQRAPASPPPSPAVERFKARIGFGAAAAAPPANAGIVVRWPEQGPSAALGPGWTLASTNVWREGRAGVRTWSFARGPAERITATVSIHPDAADAKEALVRAASLTMASEIPYERSDAGLGDLCVVSSSPRNDSYIWWRRTACLQVKASDTDADVLSVARALDALAAAGVVPDPGARTPKISFESPAPSVPVDSKLDLVLKTPANAAAGWMIEAESSEQLLVDRVADGRAIWRTRKAGTSKAIVHALDRSTLLVGSASVEVRVTPAPAP